MQKNQDGCCWEGRKCFLIYKKDLIFTLLFLEFMNQEVEG